MRLQNIKARLDKHPALSCFFAGILFSLSYINEWLFLFTYIGLTLFLFVFFGDRGRAHPFKRAFSFYMGALPVIYSWFVELYPFPTFGFTPFQGIVIVILAIFAISLYHSLVISLLFMLTRLIPTNHRALLPPLTGMIFVIYEWFLNLGPLKFSWATVAITQVKVLPLLQTASLFGGFFITLVVVTFCGYAALCLRDGDKGLLKTVAASIVMPMLAGTLLLVIPSDTGKKINAAVIQGNVLSDEKWQDMLSDDIINTYVELTEQAAQNGAKLIVLPESAFPVYFTKNGKIHTRLAEITKNYGCAILTGALIQDDGKKNALIGIRPDGTLTNYYVKNNLVPFGETLPFEDLVNLFFDIMGIEFSRVPYVEGTDPDIIELDGVSYGGVICFDSIFPETVRASVRAGAEVLIIATNDSWYKDAPAVKQHVWHAAVRAVESGRYVVRAANTGISCFITPKGEIINATEPLVKDIAYAEVSPSVAVTPYQVMGDVPFYVALTAYALLIISAIFKKIQSHTKSARTTKKDGNNTGI